MSRCTRVVLSPDPCTHILKPSASDTSSDTPPPNCCYLPCPPHSDDEVKYLLLGHNLLPEGMASHLVSSILAGLAVATTTNPVSGWLIVGGCRGVAKQQAWCLLACSRVMTCSTW